MAEGSPSTKLLVGLTCLLAFAVIWFGWSDHYSLWTIYPSRPIWGRDFYAGYLTEAAILRDGALEAIWNPKLNAAWQVKHGFPNVFNELPYPPLMALFWVPATYLTPYDAVSSWFYCNILMAFVIGCWSVWIAAYSLKWKERLLLSVVAGSSLIFAAPSMDVILSGQMSLFLVLLLLIFISNYTAGRKVIAAAALALAISLKIYPFIFTLVPLARRDYKFVGGVAAGCLLLLAPFLVYTGSKGLGAYTEYFTQVLPTLAGTGSALSDQSIKGVAIRYLGDIGGPLGTLGSLLMLAISAYFLRRRRLELTADCSYIFAVVSLLQICCIGRSWPNYHVILWPTVAFAYRAKINPQAVLGLLGLVFIQALFDGEVTGSTDGILVRNVVMTWGSTLFVNLAIWGILLSQAEPPTVDELETS